MSPDVVRGVRGLRIRGLGVLYEFMLAEKAVVGYLAHALDLLA